MAIQNFKHRYQDSVETALNIGFLINEGNLTNEEIVRLEKIKEAWNFYEGYHWEGLDDLDKPQITTNYCGAFVNKFVSFEFGKSFSIKGNHALETTEIDETKVDTNKDFNKDGEITDEEFKEEMRIVPKTVMDFLNDVWDDNGKDILLTEIGQTKSVTGDAWVKVQFESPEDLDDPFVEYPKGRIRLSVTPTQYVFPTFDNHDKDKLNELLIMYPIERETQTGILFHRTRRETVVYKELWTRKEIAVFEGKEEIDRMPNPYGIIPFVQIKNFPVAGRSYGVGDIDDVIPLNVEYNLKRSDVSEIIDYHSAPITVVYGAKIGNLEKGANKVWGGLPKDAKIDNLKLEGDLVASTTYITDLKTSMCEVGGVPETVLGGASAISNTSGVALQYINLPLIERTRIKRLSTQKGLAKINKFILYIALAEGLITKPEEIEMRNFLYNEVTLPDTLPKDELLELQQIQTEMTLGMECRHGAMERLGKDDINNKINEIDAERSKHPELFNPLLQQALFQSRLNSGMTNGQTPVEQVRTEMTGKNGGATL